VEGIVKLLEDREGVRIRLGAKVKKIEGCRGEEGVMVDGERFDAVVCNVEVAKALEGLIKPSSLPGPSRTPILSSSVLQFHWILEGEDAGAKLRAHNVFLSDDEVGSWDAVRAGDRSAKKIVGGSNTPPHSMPPFNFYVHNPGCGDDTACVGGGTVLMALVPIANGANVSKEEVAEWEGWVRERVERRTGPIRIIYSKCTTPEEWEENYGLPGGAVFGSSHGLLQLGPTRQGCKVEGLKGGFFVGASKRPGNGVPLVMIGAEKTAQSILDFLQID
jgi:phytoene desaturase (3,4-didehydrolycopene-forming)